MVAFLFRELCKCSTLGYNNTLRRHGSFASSINQKTKRLSWKQQFKNAIAGTQQAKRLFVLVVITALAVHALVVALAARSNVGEALSSPYFKNLKQNQHYRVTLYTYQLKQFPFHKRTCRSNDRRKYRHSTSVYTWKHNG